MTTPSKHRKAPGLPNHPLTAFELNQRVQLDDSHGPKGTVRYIGTLEGQPSNIQFTGVEWDEPVGKNDGSIIVDNVTHRYFTCSDKHGSFVRHQRLLPSRSINQAMMDKYCLELDPIHRDALTLRARNGSKFFSIHIEFKGLEDLQAINKSIARMSAMQHASLIGLQISTADIEQSTEQFNEQPSNQSNTYHTITPSLIDLDLSDNLIRSWSTVCHYIEPLHQLHTLKLSRNNLLPLSIDQSVDELSLFSRLRVLVLTEVTHAWQSVIIAQLRQPEAFKHLEELHVSKNHMKQISQIDVPADSHQLLDQSVNRLLGSADSTTHVDAQTSKLKLNRDVLAALFPSLRVLDLSFNLLSDWNEVLALASIPHLSTLILGHNQLTEMHCGSADFPNLARLFLSDNNLKSFDSLDHLSHLPSLKDIRLLRNQGLDTLSSHVMSTLRAHAIARIPNLQLLNGSAISRRERIDSDKFYVKYAQRSFAERASTDPNITIQQMFPRYEARARLFGEEMPQRGSSTTTASSASLSTSGLAANTINVTLEVRNADDSVVHSQSKKVLRTTKVSVMRMLLDKQAGVRPADRNDWVLKINSDGKGTDWQVCDDVLKPLSHYDPQDGTKIVLAKS